MSCDRIKELEKRIVSLENDRHTHPTQLDVEVEPVDDQSIVRMVFIELSVNPVSELATTEFAKTDDVREAYKDLYREVNADE